MLCLQFLQLEMPKEKSLPIYPTVSSNIMKEPAEFDCHKQLAIYSNYEMDEPCLPLVERGNLGSPSIDFLVFASASSCSSYRAFTTDGQAAGKERLLSVAMRSAPGAIVQLFSLLCLPQVRRHVHRASAMFSPRPVTCELLQWHRYTYAGNMHSNLIITDVAKIDVRGGFPLFEGRYQTGRRKYEYDCLQRKFLSLAAEDV